MNAFVVENEPDHNGAVGRVYVSTEDRARQIVAQGADVGVKRSYREIPLAEMPAKARENMERARSEG